MSSETWLLRPASGPCSSGPIFKWTLPAWAGRMADGRTYNTCPMADACVKLCYARAGTYQFPQVREVHERNLARVLDDLEGWEWDMSFELMHPRYHRGPMKTHVRVHDSGDFLSPEYTEAWLRIMRRTPNIVFYAYTKSISMFREVVEPDPPPNFAWVYSLGGREDHLIDRERDRHADVFTDLDAMVEAGYASTAESDLLAIYGPRKVGVTANNIPHLRRAQGEESFGEIQTRRARRRGPGKQYDSGRP